MADDGRWKTIRAQAVAYAQRLSQKRMVLRCSNNVVVEINWDADNFLHLLGVDCLLPRSVYRDKNNRRKSVSRLFVELSQSTLSDETLLSGMRCLHDEATIDKKIAVMNFMLQAESARLTSVLKCAENDSVYSFFIGDGNHCVGITLHKVQNPIDPDGKVYFPRSFQYYARGIESMKDFADKLDVSSITLVPVPSPVDTKPVRHRKRKK
nr:PBECR4 domain-containing protein [Bifidobacterium catenulatum]